VQEALVRVVQMEPKAVTVLSIVLLLLVAVKVELLLERLVVQVQVDAH
jgi:hypothetical protein